MGENPLFLLLRDDLDIKPIKNIIIHNVGTHSYKITVIWWGSFIAHLLIARLVNANGSDILSIGDGYSDNQ
ncbi:hypothetical protein C6H65_17890 [Photorhabdus luminescens]|nr:hypothetical protein C6H65_17890 [Photorhabdus luminescens]